MLLKEIPLRTAFHFIATRVLTKVPKDARIIKNLKYAEYKGESVELDLYLPIETKMKSPLEMEHYYYLVNRLGIHNI